MPGPVRTPNNPAVGFQKVLNVNREQPQRLLLQEGGRATRRRGGKGGATPAAVQLVEGDDQKPQPSRVPSGSLENTILLLHRRPCSAAFQTLL